MATMEQSVGVQGQDERVSTATLAPLVYAPFVGMLSVLAFSPFLPAMAAELGASIALLGQVPALTNLLAAGLALVIGPLADRVGHRRALLAGATAVVAVGLGTAAATTYGLLLAVAAVGAAGRATIQPVAIAVASTRFAGATRQRAISWTMAGVSGAPVVGVPLLTSVADFAGWRGAFLTLAGLGLGALLLVRHGLVSDPPPATNPGPWHGALAAYTPLARHSAVLGLVGAVLLSNTGIWALLTYLGAFLAERHGFSTQQIGWAYLVHGLGFFIGTVAAGGRLGRMSLRPLLATTLVGQGALMGLAFLLPIGPIVAVLLVALAVFLSGLGLVATAGLLMGATPTGRATTMALHQAAMALGATAGGSVGGLLLALGGYGAVGLLLPTVSLAAALLAWRSRAG